MTARSMPDLIYTAQIASAAPSIPYELNSVVYKEART